MGAGVTDATNSTVVADPALLMPDGTDESTVTVSLIDSELDPVGAGHLVSLVCSANGEGVTITPAHVVSDASGEAVFTISGTLIHTGGEKSAFIATDTSDGVAITQSPTIDFFPIMDQVETLMAISPDLAEPDETDTVDIELTVLDANSDPIEALQISLAATANKTGVVITPEHDDTDSSGVVAFTATSTTSHTGATATVFQATDDDNSIVLAKTVTGEFRMFADAAESSVEISAATCAANGVDSLLVMVTCLDSEGDPVPNIAVSLSTGESSSGVMVNGTEDAGTATTDADGVAVFTVTSTVVYSGLSAITFTATAVAEDVEITETVEAEFIGLLSVSPNPLSFATQRDVPFSLQQTTKYITITGTPKATSGGTLTVTGGETYITCDETWADGVAAAVSLVTTDSAFKIRMPMDRAPTITIAADGYTSIVLPVHLYHS